MKPPRTIAAFNRRRGQIIQLCQMMREVMVIACLASMQLYLHRTCRGSGCSRTILHRLIGRDGLELYLPRIGKGCKTLETVEQCLAL